MSATTSSSAPRAVLAAMTLANAMILVDQTAVPLALPDIAQELRVDAQLVQWVLNASLLPLAGLLVLGGRLGDVLGRRRIFVLGAVLFAGASAVGGLAPTFLVLLVARVCQGVGGALMLPATVAIVSVAFPREQRGRALGTMGGVAAVAGALGPTIGGALTSAISWRAVLLINLPLLVVTLWTTLRAVPADEPTADREHIDLRGAALACVALVGLVLGLAQTTVGSWASPGVVVPLVLAVLAGVLFVRRERRAGNPLMDLALLRRHPNYLGATVSQGLAGMAEMGLGLILPLVLVLNLQLDPAVAGVALLATTVPMVAVAPVVGRWYDRAGGRPPLVTGFAVLAVSGLLLAATVDRDDVWWLLPGLVVYGVGLAIVLTVNDPVSLDTVPERDHGQASGVSATAEQGGGAIGIALLYAVFHLSYLTALHHQIQARALPPLTPETGSEFRDAIEGAEQSGLVPRTFDPRVVQYLDAADHASDLGYVMVFLVVAALGVVGLVASAWLVRAPGPDGPGAPDPGAAAEPVGSEPAERSSSRHGGPGPGRGSTPTGPAEPP